MQLHEQRLGQFGDVTDGRCTYPIEKCRTKQSIEALRQAEANLDAFWVTADRHMHAVVGNLKGTSLGRLLSQPRVLQRTPEWVEPAPKPDVKAANTRADAAAAIEDDLNPEDPQPTMAVDARALEVFRCLFHNPETTSTPGEVLWTDFLHALASTGFTAEKLYGSVWQFRPTLLDVERPIQFHEPHPQTKISFAIASRHGRRLHRAYGWFGGMFVLKES